MRFLLLIFGLSAGLAAQPLRIDYFTVNDGLSTPEINHLHIGDDGFLWVSTMDGLNRFDGQTFRRFGERTDEGPGLSRAAIAAVHPDNEGKFIVTFNDFFGYFDRFDPRDFSVEQVRLVPSTGVVGYPRAIATDRLGRTFVVSIGTAGTSLYEYTPNPNASQNFTRIYNEPGDAWTTLTPEVQLLTHSDGSFLLYDEEHGFRHISPTGKLLDRPFSNLPVVRRMYGMVEAADGRVYMSQRAGLALYTWRPGDAYPVPALREETRLRYNSIFRSKSGQLLLTATEDILGLQYPVEYALVDTAGKFTEYEELGLPLKRKVSAMAALDFRGTVYLGLREGLGVLQRKPTAVATYLERTEEDLFNNRVTGLAEDRDGVVYVMTVDGGTYRLGPERDFLEPLPLRLAGDTLQNLTFRSGSDLIYDPAHHRLLGVVQPPLPARGGLLFAYDIATATTREVRFSQLPQTLAVGPDGWVYISVADTKEAGLLLRWNERAGAIETVPTPAGRRPIVSGFLTNELRTSRDGERLLLATNTRGLLTYDPTLQILANLYDARPPDADEEQGSPTVYTVREDTAGYWLGTEAGLLHYPPGATTPVRYGRREELSSNVVLGVLPDSSGGYWLSTQHGLTRLPPGREPAKVRRYYRTDGLSNDEFLPRSYLRTTDGRYFFGGINGLTSFREADFARDSTGSNLMLTEVSVVGRGRVRNIRRDLADLRQVTVFAREKGIAISFAVPAGQPSGGGRFRYQLEGFNEDWVPLVNERTIRFNNLAGGKYVLRIQAAGPSGNYGSRELRLLINVRQYVIEQRWFQILIVLSFLALVYFILQARLRERLRNEQLRTQLSADIHDEVSGLLAGITLQAELLKNRTEDETLRQRLHRVGDAGRQAMSKMSDVIWSIDSRRDTIGNLLQRMQEHADEVLLPLDIRYDFKATGLDKERELPGNVRQDLYFIYKEAVNNVVRHSNASRVRIEVEQFAQYFELLVHDNGRPAPDPATATDPHTRVLARKKGQGTDNMRMRAERLGGELTISEGNGFTTRFRMKRI